MRFRGATIFVTGGAGFIGSAVIRHLLEDTEAQVVNLDKLTYASSLDLIPCASGHQRYRFAQVDICNGPALRRLFDTHQPHCVMNSRCRKSCRPLDRRSLRVHPDQHRWHFHLAAGGLALLAQA